MRDELLLKIQIIPRANMWRISGLAIFNFLVDSLRYLEKLGGPWCYKIQRTNCCVFAFHTFNVQRGDWVYKFLL